MGQRLVIERLAEGSVPPSTDGTRKVAAPTLGDIRIVFGVGSKAETPADDRDFKPVYRVSMPVFSLGGLDPDGVHEFDAASLLGDLQRRATRRRWSVRLELDVIQPAESVTSADLVVDTPLQALTFDVVGRTRKGTTLPGGGRSLTLATSLIHDPAQLDQLAGEYSMRLTDAPDADGTASVESPARLLKLALTNYEFQG